MDPGLFLLIVATNLISFAAGLRAAGLFKEEKKNGQ